MELASPPASRLSPGARAYLGVIYAAGALAVIASAGLLAYRGGAPALAWLIAPACAFAMFATQRSAFILRWRGQRLATTVDEPVIALALLALPAPMIPLAVMTGVTASQLVAGRRVEKAAYNMGAYSLAAALGALAFVGATRLGALPLVAATIGVVTYSFSSNLLLAGLFAAVDRGSPVRIFAERFALSTFASASLGAALAASIVALWLLHPLALIAVVPLLGVGFAFSRMQSRSEREGLVRNQLAAMSRSIGALTEVDEVAERIVRACGELFLAGRVTLTLAPSVGRGRAEWSQEFEGGVRPKSAPLIAPLLGRNHQILGELAVYPPQRAPSAKDVRVDAPLLALVAGEAAARLDVALAVRELVDLMSLHEGIVRNMPAGLLRIDGTGKAVQANAYLATQLGDPAAAWAALSAAPDLRSRVERALRGEAFHLQGVRLGPRVYDLAGVPLAGHGEAQPAAVVLFHDVTDRAEAEEAERRHSITRPLVRRIILDLVHNTAASGAAIGTLGRRLAGEVRGDDVQAYVEAFRQMGLGDLMLRDFGEHTYSFTADDLIERRDKAREPTCHLARGFLEGAIARLHGADALGTEIRCQSQGHERCEFIVKPRAVAAARPRASARGR